MARVFISGSTDGLGRGAAQTLMAEGHEVVPVTQPSPDALDCSAAK